MDTRKIEQVNLIFFWHYFSTDGKEKKTKRTEKIYMSMSKIARFANMFEKEEKH
jgi:hypothetical protein